MVRIEIYPLIDKKSYPKPIPWSEVNKILEPQPKKKVMVKNHRVCCYSAVQKKGVENNLKMNRAVGHTKSTCPLPSPSSLAASPGATYASPLHPPLFPVLPLLLPLLPLPPATELTNNETTQGRSTCSPLLWTAVESVVSEAYTRVLLRRTMGWGEPPAPQQRKAAGGGGLKLLLSVLLVGLALRLLVNPSAYLLLSSSSTTTTAAVALGQGDDAVLAGGGSLPSNGEMFLGSMLLLLCSFSTVCFSSFFLFLYFLGCFS